MIDWAKVNELRDEVGAEDFDEVVELFLSEVDEVLPHLGADGRPLEEDLHFLKGCALNLGFVEFSQLCHSGETACASGNAGAVDSGAVVACYQSSKNTFLAELNTRMAS